MPNATAFDFFGDPEVSIDGHIEAFRLLNSPTTRCGQSERGPRCLWSRAVAELATSRRSTPGGRTTRCNEAHSLFRLRTLDECRPPCNSPAERPDIHAVASSSAPAHLRKCRGSARPLGSATGSDGPGRCCPETR